MIYWAQSAQFSLRIHFSKKKSIMYIITFQWKLSLAHMKYYQIELAKKKKKKRIIMKILFVCKILVFNYNLCSSHSWKKYYHPSTTPKHFLIFYLNSHMLWNACTILIKSKAIQTVAIWSKNNIFFKKKDFYIEIPGVKKSLCKFR